MMHRNRFVNGKGISGIALLLCLVLLSSCRTAEGDALTESITSETGLSQSEKLEVKVSQTSSKQTTSAAETAIGTERADTAENTEQPETDWFWLNEYDLARLRRIVQGYADRKFYLFSEYDNLTYLLFDDFYEVFDSYMFEKISGRYTANGIQVGNCYLEAKSETVPNSRLTFSHATAYGHRVELKIPFLPSFTDCVINYDDKVIVSVQGNTYVFSENGVHSELQEDYDYSQRSYSKKFIRFFMIEDGKLRCLRVPEKFTYDFYDRLTSTYHCFSPGINFPDEKYMDRLRFCGYGELWYEWSDVTFDENGAPVYTVTESQLVDESVAVRCFLGEEAYQRYVDGTLSEEELQTAKDNFDTRAEYSAKHNYVMIH